MLYGRTGAGFVTCCCVHLQPDGTGAAATAGHLNPYCNGREIELDPGLPLALSDEAVWKDAPLVLAPGEQLTIVSDGVVEAANTEGELFGFARTREISGKSAQAIAEAARDWGQNDDITVITVRRS